MSSQLCGSLCALTQAIAVDRHLVIGGKRRLLARTPVETQATGTLETPASDSA